MLEHAQTATHRGKPRGSTAAWDHLPRRADAPPPTQPAAQGTREGRDATACTSRRTTGSHKDRRTRTTRTPQIAAVLARGTRLVAASRCFARRRVPAATGERAGGRGKN
ncbi:hypothetical protein ZWY2020_019874 [Hordeum vulgare]|nr:hypothetical protein ZWY2020_019874 [Hordeum vulgare]